MLNFSEFVKNELKNRGMSQGQLAIKSGVSRSSLVSWIAGCPAKKSSMEIVLNALGYDLKDLEEQI